MRRHLLRSRRGQALVEYAVILALIGAGLMAILAVLRNGVGAAYEETGARLDTVACEMGRDAACRAPVDPDGGLVALARAVATARAITATERQRRR